MGEPAPGDRTWPRAVGLFVVTLGLAVLQPVLLIALPFALLAFVVPGHRLAALALAGVVVAMSLTGSAGSGLWYVERAWAVLVGGWFVVLTLVWPARGFTPRGLAAVGGGAAWAGALFLVWPDGWTVTDWVVSERIVRGSMATLEALRVLQGGGALPEPLVSTVERTAALQGRVFPALLALSSLSALGVAWWLHLRLSFGRDGGLSPLRSFRFHDQLVWVFIGGVILLVWGWTEGWSRLGENLVVFMAALYAFRGLAVFLAISGGISIVGYVVAAVATVLAAPMVLAGAFALGLGDTWLDLRSRFRDTPDPGPDGGR